MQTTISYNSLRARGNDSLSLDEMRAKLPAIFAPAPHESRSSRYVHISTEDVIGALMKEGFEPTEARVTRSRDDDRRGHAKHLVRLRSRMDVASRSVGDTSFEVVLRNAHDGTASYNFMAGLFRLACLNGMVVSLGSMADVRVKHSGNRQAQLDQVVHAALAVVESAPIALEAPRQWSQIMLLPDEQMALADGARTLRFGDADGNVESPIQAGQLLEARRAADTGADLWHTFQRVQENAIRGGLSAWRRDETGRRVRRITTREVKGIDQDIRLNKALWQLADAMAKIKMGTAA